MELNWEYRADDFSPSDLVVSLKHNGMLNVMSLGSSLKITSHRIDTKSKIENRGQAVLWNREIQIIPEQFLNAEPLGMEIDTKVLLRPGVFLCYKGKQQQHLFQAVYLQAELVSRKHANLLFVWHHEGILYVICFKGGMFVFGNVFMASDIQEAIYFALSAAQDTEIHRSEFAIFSDAESQFIFDFQEKLGKLGLSTEVMKHEWLYPQFLSSPYQHLSYYLQKMPGLAVPEDYELMNS
jgi:hypothetical protein